MSDKKALIIQIASSQAVAIGMMLESLDLDNVGKDDLTGQILVAVGTSIQGYQKGDDGKFNAAIRTIHEVTGNYLDALKPKV